MTKITQERLQEVRNAFRVLGSLTDEELNIFLKGIYLEKSTVCKPTPSKERTYEDVVEIIHKIGLKPNLMGYDYLREAIIYHMKATEESKRISLTKDLYPAIAFQYKTTVQRVERAIRHAIQTVFERGNFSMLREMFTDIETTPTNSEAIATMAEYLRIRK